MLHENVMMVLHWRTSSFFAENVFCWFPVCLTPIEDIQHHLADLNQEFVHHNPNFYFNSNLFLNEYFLFFKVHIF